MDKEPEQTDANAGKLPVKTQPLGRAEPNKWWHSPALWISVGSLICTMYSATNTNRAANAATRSADAAAMSANAAMTNAEWVSYQRNPHHDLIARVLRVGFVMRGYSSEDT